MQLVEFPEKDSGEVVSKEIPRTNTQKCLELKVKSLQKQRGRQAASPIGGEKIHIKAHH